MANDKTGKKVSTIKKEYTASSIDKSLDKVRSMINAPVTKDGKLSYTLYDSNGKEVGKTYVKPGTDMSNIKSKVFSQNPDGTWSMYDKDNMVQASVSLDKATGKITVNAPDISIKNESFKKNIEEPLKAVSQAYKMNPDYKFTYTDENGENKEKSIQQVIDEFNAPAKNEDGTLNESSISYLATAAMEIESKKKAFKEATKLDFSDEDIMRIETVAIGPEVKDNTLQLISDLPEAYWLRNIGTYDKDTGTAQYKDIMENAYNKEKVSSEDMIKLWASLENYFAKGDFSDKDQYIKNVATVRFLDANQPNMSWIRDVTENVRGFLDGIGGFSTELGTSLASSVSHLGRDLAKDIFGLESKTIDTSNIYLSRGGSQYAKNMPGEKVDGKIARLRVNSYGVPVYQEEDIEGYVDNPTGAFDVMRNIFKENQAVIRKDMEFLHASQAGWDTVGYTITNLAALISAGNFMSNLFVKTTGVVASGLARVGMSEKAITSAVEFGQTMYASGTMLGFGSTPEEAAAIVNGLKTIYDIASVTDKAATLANFINTAVTSAKATEFIIGVVGESFAEAVVGDPNRLVEVINNKEIDADTKQYLIETYIGNALGWGVGMGVGKFLLGAGDTVRGRAISYNTSRRIFKIQNAVGDAFDRLLLTIRGVDGTDLKEKILTLYEKGGKYAKKQANALAYTQLIRQMRKVIAESPEIKIRGKSAEEIEKALKEVESKVLKLQNAEIALNSMQRQGMDIVQGWLKDDGTGIKEVMEDFYSKAGKVSDLEKASGDLFKSTRGSVTNLSNGKTIKLFSQATTNYIKATEKIDFIYAYINKYEHAAGVTEEIVNNIRKYREELPELQKMVKTFVDNASPELKLAADEFIDADRKWWSKFETLRARLGLTDKTELRGMRGSGLWGSNGELYARTSRKADLSEYIVKHRDGASNVKTFDTYENYMAGASGDFVDPLGEMQIALYDAGNKQAYRSFTRSYNALTGSLTTKVSGNETAFYQKMQKGLMKSYYDQTRSFLKNIAENTYINGHIDDAIDNLQIKNQKYGEMKLREAVIKDTEEKSKVKLDPITSENAGRYIGYLDAEDTNDLWDEFYDVPVRDLLADGEQYVPENTKRMIYRKARELGVSSAYTETEDVYKTVKHKYDVNGNPLNTKEGAIEDAILSANEKRMKAIYDSRNSRDFTKYPKNKEGLKAWYKDNPLAADYADAKGAHGDELRKYKEKYSKRLLDGAEDYVDPKYFDVEEKTDLLQIKTGEDESLVETYDKVVAALGGTEDSVDDVFEGYVKRQILAQNENVLNDTRVQKYLTEQRQMAYEAKMETFLDEIRFEYQQVEEEYGITVASLDNAGRETIESYIEAVTRKGSPQRAAIDEICKFYGLEGDPNAIRYFALSAFVDNESQYKKELYEKIREVMRKKYPDAGDAQNDKIAAVLTKGVAKGIEEEYHDAYLIVKEINENAVHEATEKITKDIKRIANEIEINDANRYAGDKNIIAMRNAQGQVEYYEADPLLARLVNFQYTAEKMNGLTQAIYNTNYLWTKLFRLGTTAINLKSMMSQMFRDPINMFIGGGAYKTGQQCIDEIVDVAGDDIVAWYKTYEPEALSRLQKTANETGQDIKRLAVEREMRIGKAISPASTETNMYKSLKTAKTARLNGTVDIYDDTKTDKVVRGINRVEDVLAKGNEWRETTLRNISYANGLSKALKRGYSVSDARKYATFVMNEATTNFTRMTNHLTALKDTVPYFGSAINGSKSFFKLFSMDPVGVVGRFTGGIIIPTIALTANSLLSEENRQIYKNIKEYEKEDALVFVINGRIISIPMPQEFSSFMAPWRQFVEGLYGVSTNNFAQLAWHDILGLSPIDLTGFADLDFAKLEQSSPGFLNRIGNGIARMWAQLAPAPLKSGLEVITGVDPYTGKEIDKSYLDYDEDGNPIIKDYQSGELAKALNNMFRSWGLTSSAPVVQNILSNIIGQASVDIFDFLVSFATQVPNIGRNFTATEEQLSRGEAYNPFYVLEQRLTSPLIVDAYDEAQSAWKTEVAKLYNRKEEILTSKEWLEYVNAKRTTSDPEKLKNINASKKNIVEDYYNTVKNVVQNLQKNYGAQLTPVKFATVLSLMTMNEQTLDAGSYGDYLMKEEFKTTRAQAIQTMINMGFQNSPTGDILGRYETDKDGNIKVVTTHPLALLQLDDPYGASLSSQSTKHHFAVVRGLIGDADLYDERSSYQKKISAAFNKKDYNEAERLANEYNEKLIRIIGPYIQQYTPESVLKGDALDYISNYVIVPSSFQINKYGKYASGLGNGAYKSDAFKEPYVKYIFNYGKNKL